MVATALETPPQSPRAPIEARNSACDSARGLPAVASAVALLLLASACVSTPVTGRKAFNLIPVESDVQLGAQAYSEAMAQSKVADNHPKAPMVHNVVTRLVKVAQPDVPVPFDWEVHVVQDDAMVNAWCMPGGKMAVYTGILPFTQDANGLAVVMGHEIAHAVARHGTERMTHQMGIEAVLAYIAGDYAALGGQAAGLLVLMPWGRKQELEADEIGLIYMARAGFDPREAPKFWERMAAASSGAPPEWLSTHPSNENRIKQLNELMPKAMAEYEAHKVPKP
jgi:metalloendopeptidase OMA1, mitochondrial